jgi:hypothetical protein
MLNEIATSPRDVFSIDEWDHLGNDNRVIDLFFLTRKIDAWEETSSTTGIRENSVEQVLKDFWILVAPRRSPAINAKLL